MLLGAAVALSVAASALSPQAAPTASAAASPAASSAGARAGSLDWRLCAKVTKDWEPKDKRTVCAEMRVPLDYAKPQGRTITVAVSRIRASDPSRRRGILFYSPGGPGITNLDAPLTFTGGGLETLGEDFDVVGLDPRGTGHSDKIDCEEKDYPLLPPGASERRRDRVDFGYEAEFNRRCAALDPQLVASMTPANVARDVDSLRAALGEAKIDFYGVSFGTAIGAAYRSHFDDRVHHMWLDSPVPPVFDQTAMDRDQDTLAEQAFEDFTGWLALRDAEFHTGTTKDAVRRTLLRLRDRLDRRPVTVDGIPYDRAWVVARLVGGPGQWAANADDLAAVLDGSLGEADSSSPALPGPPTEKSRQAFGLGDPVGSINAIQYNAMLCNAGAGPTGFAALWSAKMARRRALPAAGGLFFTASCAQWPLRSEPMPITSGSSPLQISGHLEEGITPYVWATQMQRATGGTLLTVDDDRHGSLSRLPCASKAIDFFRNGTPAEGSCPGEV